MNNAAAKLPPTAPPRSDRTALRRALEKRLGVPLTRGWILDGAGPARYGWGAIHPCKTTFLAATLEGVANKIAERDCTVDL